MDGSVEERVAEAVRAGDEDLFAELAARHRHELRVHCYRMLGSFTDAEDLVQETLLRAWRGRAGFEGRSSFRAWLYRIATNACLDALDGPARRREIAVAVNASGDAATSGLAEVPWLQPYPDGLLDRAAPAAGEPEAAAIARETVELAFLAVIQHLPPRQRAVVVLRDVVGWSAQETSEALETSVASVKSALQRARATLREKLPERRAEWRSATGIGDAERALLRRYVDASRRADLSELTALLREDARQTMPPAHLVYDGREAILDMWRPVLAGEERWGAWHCVPLAVNRQPAMASYIRRPGEETYSAVNIDVLCVEDGLITEITTFGPEVLPAAGLPLSLSPADIDM
ncbi:sigma-70 family RNA polymerase sigma factor [Streptomyces sp. TRM43335]|uniref:RNA polymerase sigma factor n=1 Tax=Streptomyces taklimakanensis TaxID=2569853 RepID=A0A6G2BEE4_9ACTN|nr:RNA polymerase subunit sigma-70 [Streptomyces taklimakanensis]MTE20628.1 sigma-70 family RNA polymerase sigma factor [Streptomyces taklimakanensis]